VLGKPGLPAGLLAASVRGARFAGPVIVEPDPPAAVAQALTIATGPADAVLVTGSLYLVGQARERWYPERAIVLQRTPWPALDAPAARREGG
jgi:hypothetical protein